MGSAKTPARGRCPSHRCGWRRHSPSHRAPGPAPVCATCAPCTRAPASGAGQCPAWPPRRAVCARQQRLAGLQHVALGLVGAGSALGVRQLLALGITIRPQQHWQPGQPGPIGLCQALQPPGQLATRYTQGAAACSSACSASTFFSPSTSTTVGLLPASGSAWPGRYSGRGSSNWRQLQRAAPSRALWQNVWATSLCHRRWCETAPRSHADRRPCGIRPCAQCRPARGIGA